MSARTRWFETPVGAGLVALAIGGVAYLMCRHEAERPRLVKSIPLMVRAQSNPYIDHGRLYANGDLTKTFRPSDLRTSGTWLVGLSYRGVERKSVILRLTWVDRWGVETEGQYLDVTEALGRPRHEAGFAICSPLAGGRDAP